ncbi:hypothetical protein QBC32DRAFT_358114 [Pseudoneurospora amorphoporcata]|uniref:Uncharacterized protein n=1 Tax=Pseudoneurospora amorphoporcata TaxID=241081 RepID=A0AAN6P5D0_9PEZI|nr:hypothetical protein QBC32DRAFT_358114 [Pseudoneurospora amorphoporcata]
MPPTKENRAATSVPKSSRDLAPPPRKKRVASDDAQSLRATKKIAIDDPSSDGPARPRHSDNGQTSKATEDERRQSESPMKLAHMNLERREEEGKLTSTAPGKTLESTSSPEANIELSELPKMRRQDSPDDHDSESAKHEETSSSSSSQASNKAKEDTSSPAELAEEDLPNIP